MKKIMFALFALAAITISPPPATAGLQALISLHEGSGDIWERRVAIQELLRGRFGFDEVRFLVDATPGEVPSEIRDFLEAPHEPGDRRLVWISGLDRADGGSICGSQQFKPIRPTAPSLILAPTCYTEVIAFPQGSRHYGVTAPDRDRAEARIGRTNAGDAPWIALITLPSARADFVVGANSLVYEHLKRAASGLLDPAAILQTIRTRFRWNGADFTPSLDLYDRGVGRSDIRPFGFVKGLAESPDILLARRATARTPMLDLYPRPEIGDGAAISLPGETPVQILRGDRDGHMRFVAIGARLFGWVKANDLAL